jgi:hypothetical protein
MLSSLRSSVIQGAKRMGMQRTVAIAGRAPAALAVQQARVPVRSFRASSAPRALAGAPSAASAAPSKQVQGMISLQQLKEKVKCK